MAAPNTLHVSMQMRFNRSASFAPDHTHHAFLAASLAQLGNGTAAAAHAREVLQREPAFTAEGFLDTLHYQQHSDKEHLRDGLVKAGLPG